MKRMVRILMWGVLVAAGFAAGVWYEHRAWKKYYYQTAMQLYQIAYRDGLRTCGKGK